MSTTLTGELAMFASAPTNTLDQADMWRRRLALFAAVCALLSAFITALGAAYKAIVAGGISEVPIGAYLSSLGAFATPAITWLVLRRGPRSGGFLIAADALIVMATLGFHGAHLLMVPPHAFARFDLVFLLVADLLLLSRAVVVPSRLNVSVLVAALSTAIVVMVGAVVGARLEHAGFSRASISIPVFVGAWSLAVSVVATLASHALHGLRSKLANSKRLGPYELERKIGEGGMGTVYLGRHALLRRPTAIKLLPPERAGEVSIARFEREVRHTAALTHPNTVAIYDYGRTGEGVFYYAMEYLDGVDLQKLVERHGPLEPARAMHVLLQICASLAEAHGTGLIHRDVKPANVLLCERGGVHDVVKVLDFGLVKDLRGNACDMTGVHTVLGTPAYLAPEAVLSAHAADARTDVYSVGALAYFLLSGEPVFGGSSIVEVIARHLTETPAPLAGPGGTTIPPALEALIMRCLAKDPNERPRDAGALRALLLGIDVPRWTDGEAAAWWACSPTGAPACERRPAQADAVSRMGADVREAVAAA